MNSTPKRLAFFERYLTVWVGLCMVAGVLFIAVGVYYSLRHIYGATL